MTDRWANVDSVTARVSPRTRARVARMRLALTKNSGSVDRAVDAIADDVTVHRQGDLIWTEGYEGHRRVWATCGDGSLIETPESIAGTAIWHAERAARGRWTP